MTEEGFCSYNCRSRVTLNSFTHLRQPDPVIAYDFLQSGHKYVRWTDSEASRLSFSYMI